MGRIETAGRSDMIEPPNVFVSASMTGLMDSMDTFDESDSIERPNAVVLAATIPHNPPVNEWNRYLDWRRDSSDGSNRSNRFNGPN
jgi:hypothetical protein